MLDCDAVQFPIRFDHWTEPTPCPDEPERVLTVEEERQRRRKISNRESARRSRMRKQRHLEGLRAQVGRIRVENRELSARLSAVAHRCILFRCDNDRLRSESEYLRRRLAEIRQLLVVRQLQRLASPVAAAVCGGFASGNEPNIASLIA